MRKLFLSIFFVIKLQIRRDNNPKNNKRSMYLMLINNMKVPSAWI